MGIIKKVVGMIKDIATDYKQVIVVRKDLKLPAGKLAAQAAHASVDAVLKSDMSIVQKWKNEGMKKIVLQVKDQREMFKYLQIAKDNGLTTAMIQDAGKTIVEPGTKTCFAIGPATEDEVDAVTGDLKTY